MVDIVGVGMLRFGWGGLVLDICSVKHTQIDTHTHRHTEAITLLIRQDLTKLYRLNMLFFV